MDRRNTQREEEGIYSVNGVILLSARSMYVQGLGTMTFG